MSFNLDQKIALITGGAAGMGYLYAQKAVLSNAAQVILWDRDAEALSVAKKELSSLGSNSVISTTVIDLSDLNQVEVEARKLLDSKITPDLLVNNAGIVAGNSYYWETDSEKQTIPIMTVNTISPMLLTSALLPAMIKTATAKRILNISSAASLVSNPRMSVYAASKWAMTAWSDSLRLELEQAEIHQIKVTTFCPSYVSTGMFAGAKGMLMTPVMTPDYAVKKAWSAMLKGKAIQISPPGAKLAKFFKGLLPQKLWDGFAKFSGVYKSMDEFVGHQK